MSLTALRSSRMPVNAQPTQRAPRVALLVGLSVGIVVLGAVSIASGSRTVAFGDVVSAFLNFDAGNDAHLVVRQLRVPRTILGILCGGALGLAGALVQALTRNPLAEPGTLSINAGAAAGVVVGLCFFATAPVTVYVWFAFVGAAIAASIVFRLGAKGGPTRLVLAGAALSVVLSAVTTIVVLSREDKVFDAMRAWSTGSLQGRGWAPLPVIVLCLVIGVVLAVVLSHPLNTVALGNDLAASLGVNTRQVRLWTSIAVLVLAAGATAVAGPIAFIGLAAPHLARRFVGPDHRMVLIVSPLLAAALLLLADVVGRLIVRPAEVGAGVMCALLGAPFFVVLVRRGRLNSL